MLVSENHEKFDSEEKSEMQVCTLDYLHNHILLENMVSIKFPFKS